MSSFEVGLHLMNRLGLDPGEVARFHSFYNEKMDRYGNEVYSLDETRLVHWMNFVSGDWFSHRLDWYLDSRDKFDVIVDLGFSIPYPYLKPPVRSEARYVFVDSEASALRFYDALMESQPESGRAEGSVALLADIENRREHSLILEALKGRDVKSMLFVLSEVIEHLEEPESAFALVGQVMQFAQRPEECRVYATLPIGLKIPSHTVEFSSPEMAREFLAQWIEPIEERILRPAWSDSPVPFLEECYCCLGTLITP